MKSDCLVYIKPPDKERTPLKVAHEVLHLYRAGFCLPISRLCRIFCCERQWIEDNFIPNIQHIFITHFFGLYIADTLKDELSPQERADFSRHMYFVSKDDLSRYYRENAAATRKTRLIDITQYRAPGSSYNELLQERDRHAERKPSKKERALHLGRMQELLTEQGYSLYLNALYQKKEWVETDLPPLPLSGSQIPFLSTSQVMREQHLSTNTSAYSYLFSRGAARVKIGGKVLWHVPIVPGDWLIPCSADAPL